jgi:hypothetical protein
MVVFLCKSHLDWINNNNFTLKKFHDPFKVYDPIQNFWNAEVWYEVISILRNQNIGHQFRKFSHPGITAPGICTIPPYSSSVDMFLYLNETDFCFQHLYVKRAGDDEEMEGKQAELRAFTANFKVQRYENLRVIFGMMMIELLQLPQAKC